MTTRKSLFVPASTRPTSTRSPAAARPTPAIDRSISAAARGDGRRPDPAAVRALGRCMAVVVLTVTGVLTVVSPSLGGGPTPLVALPLPWDSH